MSCQFLSIERIKSGILNHGNKLNELALQSFSAYVYVGVKVSGLIANPERFKRDLSLCLHTKCESGTKKLPGYVINPKLDESGFQGGIFISEYFESDTFCSFLMRVIPRIRIVDVHPHSLAFDLVPRY